MRIDLKTIFVLILLCALVTLAVRDYLNQLPLHYRPYTTALLSSTLGDGQCVVISISTSWNINSHDALQFLSHEVTRSLRRHGAVVLHADWTNNSPEVSQLTSELNANSLPVLAFFNPRDPKNSVVIRDLPREDDVLTAIDGCCR